MKKLQIVKQQYINYQLIIIFAKNTLVKPVQIYSGENKIKIHKISEREISPHVTTYTVL